MLRFVSDVKAQSQNAEALDRMSNKFTLLKLAKENNESSQVKKVRKLNYIYTRPRGIQLDCYVCYFRSRFALM